jgi:L-lactate dehydrogenase complex protein LldE
MELQLFIPCFVDQLYPEVGINMVKILRQGGHLIRYNEKQTCCGQIAFNSGNWNDARKMATKFLKDFDDSTPIISPSASCTAYLRNYYSTLFNDTTDEYARFQQLSERSFELSDFLINHSEGFHTESKFYHTVTFHDSCSGLREYKLKDEARQLLKMVEGLQLIEMDDTTECCGFGGTFSVKHKYISQAMVQQKVENALKSGAEYITSTEASCLMNIESYIRKQKLPLKTIHFTGILASGL